MLKKKLVVLNTLIVMGIGSMFAMPALAETNLQNQQSHLQQERSEIKSDLSKAEQKVADLMEEIEQINEQITRINEAMRDNQRLIEDTEGSIEEAAEVVELLYVDIEKLEREIELRYELLKDRAVSYHKNGTSVRYVEVILGSQDISDLVDRILAISKITQADSDFIMQHEANKVELEEKQTKVEAKLAELNEMRVELEGMQHHLFDQQIQNDELKNKIKINQEQTKELIANLQEKDKDLKSQELDLNARIEAERARKAEEARQAEVVRSSTSTQSTTSIQNVSRSNQSVPKPSGSIRDVLTVGHKYFGKSVYVFGGGRSAYDIQNGRFDCSGFTSWAFSQIGVNLGASTDSQKYAGRQVSTSDMRPGDLVFFNTYKVDGHVGIYMGGGKFIGAQSSTGVAIADMTSGYWKSKFNGRVVRVVE